MTRRRPPTMAEMLWEARTEAFDLLLAGYSDRWQRNLRRTLELPEDRLHTPGDDLGEARQRRASRDRPSSHTVVDRRRGL